MISCCWWFISQTLIIQKKHLKSYQNQDGPAIFTQEKPTS